MAFELHPRLAADTTLVGDLELCRVLLMNDARYPWLILVPRIEQLREAYELDAEKQAQLWREASQTGERLMQEFSGQKLNLAALGNQVPQLHLHVIARFENDAAWPGPVWGVGTAQAYSSQALDATLARLRRALMLDG